MSLRLMQQHASSGAMTRELTVRDLPDALLGSYVLIRKIAGTNIRARCRHSCRTLGAVRALVARAKSLTPSP